MTSRSMLFKSFCVIALFCSSYVSAKTAPKTFAVSLPITMGSPIGLAYNYDSKFVLSLDVTGQKNREYLSEKEIEETPDTSLMMKSQELGFMFSRYSNAESMSGWHWGLGAGYKKMNGVWQKEANGTYKEPTSGKVRYDLDIAGTTGTGRFGYRYVAEDLGFMASLFLLVKHFQNRVRDDEVEGKTPGALPTTDVSFEDAQALRRRLTTQVLPGIEIGWAF